MMAAERAAEGPGTVLGARPAPSGERAYLWLLARTALLLERCDARASAACERCRPSAASPWQRLAFDAPLVSAAWSRSGRVLAVLDAKALRVFVCVDGALVPAAELAAVSLREARCVAVLERAAVGECAVAVGSASGVHVLQLRGADFAWELAPARRALVLHTLTCLRAASDGSLVAASLDGRVWSIAGAALEAAAAVAVQGRITDVALREAPVSFRCRCGRCCRPLKSRPPSFAGLRGCRLL